MNVTRVLPRSLRRRLRATARGRLIERKLSHPCVIPPAQVGIGDTGPPAGVAPVSAGVGSCYPARLPSRSVLLGGRPVPARPPVAEEPSPQERIGRISTQTGSAVRGAGDAPAGFVPPDPAGAMSWGSETASVATARGVEVRGAAATAWGDRSVALRPVSPTIQESSEQRPGHRTASGVLGVAPGASGPALPALNPSRVGMPQPPPPPVNRSGAGDGGRGSARHPYMPEARPPSLRRVGATGFYKQGAD